MAINIKGSMNRTQLCAKYGWCGKTLNRRLRPYFKGRFDRIRLFTPGQLAEIIDVLGAWEVNVEE